MMHSPFWRRGRGGSRRQRAIVFLAYFFVILATSCATLPDVDLDRERYKESYALLPQPDTDFAAIEAAIRAKYGPEKCGFLLIPKSEEALNWRLAMIDHAKYSLDMLIYTWNDDASGWLLLSRVLEAADRGVRVRLLVDDLMFAGQEKSLASINLHPHIEARVFNPWKHRSTMGRGFEYLSNMNRLQYRMHNKLMVVDNQVALVGGRNIGDEYFGISKRFNFLDLDLLGIGPVAREVSEALDDYWNSRWAYPGEFMAEPSEKKLAKIRKDAEKEVDNEPRLDGFPRTRADWSSRLNSLAERLHPGIGYDLSDRPSQKEEQETRTIFQMGSLLEATYGELLIASAYFVPNEEVIEYLTETNAKGIRVRIITNSLGSNDVVVSNSAYRKWRKKIIESGSELHEFRWDAAVKPLAETPPIQGKVVGYHRKGVVVDRRHVYVGSLNFTPRAFNLNTENGIVVENCPELAKELTELIKQDMEPENSWNVEVDEKGKLFWENSDRRVTSQPARNFGQRIQDWFFGILPLEGQI
jgi:putative cardiolipin synthase